MWRMWIVTCDRMPMCFLKAESREHAYSLFDTKGHEPFVSDPSFQIREVTMEILMEELPDEFQIIPDLSVP